ncbi:hypothetical protein CHGG_09730 [Chaetomium globosum CBS 148.51]|uniref:Uncharacterized protein n=1 Tax=Chaetomium globosum (strain ATCC 6205 / CBS 148.51 / DSM 1962 / NBRC 6347 / NRRL 1970) TaxID=306901 RepID=Q2GQM4_CHAGB|nr:uncharacterized protein CHGG_09730 [Chaetomium globosum CBS 148.51]EAQ83326.1 hypothetical protein CHGG_09730 [Chaetomium globosum CBS 148.51]
MEQHRGARPPGLRPPPGFEAPTSPQPKTTTEEQPSSTSSSAAFGLFPFPPATGFPRSPSSSAASGRSTLPEVSSEYSDRGKMEETNAWLLGHHHDQVVATMHKKFQALLDYDKTKNRKILHIDWIAGNPNDPTKKEGAAAAHGGMSAEERRLSDSVARTVMRITHGVSQWDETLTWNRAMFYGDWLNDQKGFRQFFYEIQIKRISGADEALLEKCGISPAFVWLPLHDEKAPAITPMVVPPVVPSLVPGQAPRELPIPGQVNTEPIPEVEEEEYATPTPTASLKVPTCSADKGKGKAVAPQDQADDSNPGAPLIVSSEPAQATPQQRTPLPSIDNLALGQQSSGTDDAEAPSDPGTPRPGIPRSQPLPASGSFESIDPPPSDVSDSSSESYEDEGTVYLADGVDPFEALMPAHHTPAVSAADLHHHRQEFDRIAYAKREELEHTFAFMKEPEVIERIKNSFVYSVRVVAFPDNNNIVNEFTGPRVKDRYGTIIGQGGWIVPPLEERAKWRDERKRAYRNKGAKPGKYEGLPRQQVQNCMPMKFDWSDGIEARYYGPVAPVWRETCDPTLEDIYWMVWQLIAGKQFLGFNPGIGFGSHRPRATGDVAMLNQCPFKSPSAEALYHTASHPRGKEK